MGSSLKLFTRTLCVSALASVISAHAFAERQLEMVIIETDSVKIMNKLSNMGLDIAHVKALPSEKSGNVLQRDYRIEAVVSNEDRKKLTAAGVKFTQVNANKAQQSANNTLMRAMSVDESNVETSYKSFDEPGGIREQIENIAQKYPHLTKLKTIGQSHQNRPIYAMRLTNEKQRGIKRHFKPQVLYVGTTHAREWVSTTTIMKYLNYLVDNYATDKRVKNILDTTEVWIVPVVNPDGYEYTHTNERLWRKNLNDNDGDGEITLADGVDLNRNYAGNWGRDEEGSSSAPDSNTYRGASPESEPETQALTNFIRKKRFRFAVSYHTYSDLILYPWGWQVSTPSNDDPIFLAQAGTDDNPAIYDSIMEQGYDPGVGADLYTTNGEFTDWAYGELGIPSYTVELTLGEDAEGNPYGFEFPDNADMLQTVFEDNLNFALSIAESAKTPHKPVSPVGTKVTDIYHQPLTTSYGATQAVDVQGSNRMWWKWMKYSIDGGADRYAPFLPVFGEEYNTEMGTHYSRFRAKIRGQSAGSEVTYSIIAGRDILGPYQYTVAKTDNNRVLVVANEDYSGTLPEYENNLEPNYLNYYTEALDSAGYGYDVWDMDQMKKAPDYLEVLSHYDAVVWYSGDDFAPTVPGYEVRIDTAHNIRDFINYDQGKLFASGQALGYLTSVLQDYSDDFFQYYMGAYMHIDAGGMNAENGKPWNVKGVKGDPIFDGMTLALSGSDSANNQVRSASFLPTSAFATQYEDKLAAEYDRPGGPFSPHSGDQYVYSQMADFAYKRLGKTFTVPEDNSNLSFWMSYDIEPSWDFAFVEINEIGTDTWTTLADANGNTSPDTGDACASGWVDQLHPHLANYMDADCNPTGSTGEWHGITGSSSGWKQLSFDLSAYAGKEVQFHITYASDWGTQNLGIFVDDAQVGNEPVQDFESGLGDWQITTLTPFSVNNWERIASSGFQEGPAMRTDKTVYLGFGLEAVEGADNRSTLMQRIMQYLGL